MVKTRTEGWGGIGFRMDARQRLIEQGRSKSRPSWFGLVLRLGTVRKVRVRFLLAVLLILPGCRFGTHRLDCDSPHDLEYTVVTEPPLPKYRPASLDVPDAPADLSDQRPDYEKRYLTITEAIAIALDNNPSIKVNKIQGLETAQSIAVEDSVFDPELNLGGGWTATESQILNTIDGPGPGVAGTSTDEFGPPSGASDQIIFSKKTRTGGVFRTNFGTTYSFTEPDGIFLTQNPAVRSTLSVSGSHPLLQGSGRDVNAIGIRIARQVSQSTTLQSRVLINKIIVDTATSYWKLYGKIAELTSQEKGLTEARETWQKEIKKRELGASSKTEIAETRRQYERFRTNRALFRKEVADAERSLRLILALPQEDGTRIVPTTIPRTEAPFFDWDSAYRTAFRVRPELRVQKAFVNMARLQLQRAYDGRRPNINAYAGYSVSGAGGNFSDAIEVLQNREYGSWWAGFAVQHQFGQRRSKALLRRAELGLARELQSMKSVENTILSDLHEAYQAVTNAWHIMQLQKDQEDAAQTILDSRRAKYKLGAISLEVYLRGISDASISASEERASIARYNQALIRWEYAQGTIMDFANVEFDSMDPESEEDDGTAIFIRDYLNPAEARQLPVDAPEKLPYGERRPVPLHNDEGIDFPEPNTEIDLELTPPLPEDSEPAPDSKNASSYLEIPVPSSQHGDETVLPSLNGPPDTNPADRETGAKTDSVVQPPPVPIDDETAVRREEADPFALMPTTEEMKRSFRASQTQSFTRSTQRTPRISLEHRIEKVKDQKRSED